MKGISVKDQFIYFGDKKVECVRVKTNDIKDIPRLYVIRQWDGELWRFVCGMDVMPDKEMIWLSGINLIGHNPSKRFSLPETFHRNFNGIEHIFDNLCKDTHGKPWKVFLEEPEVEFAVLPDHLELVY